MKIPSKIRLAIAAALMLFTAAAHGFSLAGPPTDWMVPSNGYPWPGYSGGPMDIGEEYRWNLPVVTYGFDQSFLDYFGSNGVAAIEGAIQILNDLPRASDIVLSNYPLESFAANFPAEAQGLTDLKSTTLKVFLDQLGLAPPTVNVFAPRRWNPAFTDFLVEGFWPEGTIPCHVVERNFDPDTCLPSRSVNGTLYSGFVSVRPVPFTWDVMEFAVDPNSYLYTAVADGFLPPGRFYMGLTRDDVGGIRYLLSARNVNYENFPAHVRTRAGHKRPAVNGAWRPGVEKIFFVRHPRNSRRFRPLRIPFRTAYWTNGVLTEQSLVRFLTQPDFLFCAADNSTNDLITLGVATSGFKKWANHAAENGWPTNAGPGVIHPPVKLTFHLRGARAVSGDMIPWLVVENRSWGSFDLFSNPIIYPSTDNLSDQFTLNFRWYGADNVTQITNLSWQLPVPAGHQAALQTSPDQVHWITLGSVVNAGAVVEWHHYGTNSAKYFRAVPE